MRYESKIRYVDAFEYVQTTRDSDAPPCWFWNAMVTGKIRRGRGSLFIETSYGTLEASLGSWIVTNKTGEIYPVSPETFKEYYEEVK